MADSKQNPDFLGGGPKFNAVGLDNRPLPGVEEPVIAPDRSGYWLRVVAVVILVVALAAFLLYLDGQNLGKTVLTPTRGGRMVSPDSKNAPPPSNLQ